MNRFVTVHAVRDTEMVNGPVVISPWVRTVRRGFGSRRHYRFASNHIVSKPPASQIVAKRWGQHPAVTAWQTDNEYGATATFSYSMDDLESFKHWCGPLPHA